MHIISVCVSDPQMWDFKCTTEDSGNVTLFWLIKKMKINKQPLKLCVIIASMSQELIPEYDVLFYLVSI